MKATIGYYFGFIALGFAGALLGPTLPRLAEQTNSTIGQASLLFPASSLGSLAGVLLGGWLLDRFAGHKLLAGALLGLVVVFLFIPNLPWLALVAAAIALMGVMGSTIDVCSNTLIVWVHRSAVGPYMNALHFFFGVGAALMPVLYATVYLRTNSFLASMAVLAALVLPVAIYIALQESPKHPAARQPGGAAIPLNKGLVLLAALCFFAYNGMEMGFGGWLFTYARTKGLAGDTLAAALTSAFWGSVTLGRLLGVPIAIRFSPRAILLTDFAICLLGAAMLVFLPGSTPLLVFVVILLGLGNASVFPTTLNLLEGRMVITGRVTSLIFIGVSLGSTFVPWLMGQLLERIGPDAAMAAVLVDTVVTLGLYLVLMFGPGSRKPVRLAAQEAG